MIVVKVGGSSGLDYIDLCDDIAELTKSGQSLVLIHGGSALTNELSTRLGHPPQFYTSPSGYPSRFTDRQTMEVFMMAYCGRNNKTIVELLQQRGVNAVGLCGIDGRIWQGVQKPVLQVVENGRKRLIRGNLTGRVEKVNTRFLRQLLDAHLLPVLCPPAIAEDGTAINVDGDRAAAVTAAALGAKELVILSNVPGVMRDIDDVESRLTTISLNDLPSVSESVAKGRMRIKLLGAAEAIQAGVGRVVIASGLQKACIRQALSGAGTVIQA